MDENSPNFVFVNIYADKKQLENMNGVWDFTKVFPNMRAADLETNSLARTVHMVFMESQFAIGSQESEFAVVNYFKVSDMANFLEFEKGTWRPFVSKAMADNQTSVKGWSVARVLSPRGAHVGFNAMTVDRFETFSEALAPTWDESLAFPDFAEHNKTNTREYIGIYALVKGVHSVGN
ncbi:MAG: hypothetical protein ACJA01_003514 [Saprospiraceae bacterium]|jgi:hypothetical protein